MLQSSIGLRPSTQRLEPLQSEPPAPATAAVTSSRPQEKLEGIELWSDCVTRRARGASTCVSRGEGPTKLMGAK